MTISFPRAMPALGVGQQTFEPDRADFLTRNQAGRLGGVTAGFPLWKASWTLAGALSTAQSDEWRAWLASLRGSQNLFFGHDVERRYPAAYPGGFAALGWSGDAASWSQAITGGMAVLTLTGLAAALALGPGDYIGFRWTTGGAQRRALVRSLEAVTASAGVAAVTVEPPVPTVVPVGAVAYLAQPDCLMRLDPAQTQLGAMGRKRVVGGTITAYQDLLL